MTRRLLNIQEVADGPPKRPVLIEDQSDETQGPSIREPKSVLRR